MKHVLAVASGKGGVGKTWFSISLACALARMNRRILLVDCDINLANIDIQLGLSSSVGLRNVFLGEVPTSQAIRTITPFGLDVLPGCANAGYLNGLDPAMIGWIQTELRCIGQDYDLVILDLPSGIESGVRELIKCADDGIILTTAEPTALADAYALIKATRKYGCAHSPRVVCNFADQTDIGRQTLDGLARVCDRFLGITLKRLGVIRRDTRVCEAIARQEPLLRCYPGSDAARDVTATAEAFLAANSRS